MAIIPFSPGANRRKPPFDQVYERYYNGALSFISKKIDNRADAEDLCSEAFIYCFEHYDEFDPDKSAISTWLYLVVNSRIKNYYRDHKSHADIDELIGFIADDGPDMDRAVYLEQLRDTLANAISTLPERQQKIVIMSYFQEKTSNEIADILGITAGNVRVQLTRALDKLERRCEAFRI